MSKTGALRENFQAMGTSLANDMRAIGAIAQRVVTETAVVGTVGTAIGKAIFPELPTFEILTDVVQASLIGQGLVSPLMDLGRRQLGKAVTVGVLSIAAAGVFGMYPKAQKAKLPHIDVPVLCQQNGDRPGGGRVGRCQVF